MIKHVRGLAGSVVMALVVAGCGGDSGGPSGSDGTMSASIDGQAWNASLAVSATHSSNVLGIGGTDGNSRQINITIPNVTSTGTINLGLGSQAIAVVVTSPTEAWTSSMVGGSGSVVITELTASGAKGTFSFTGIRAQTGGGTTQKTVTNGQFDVTF